MDKISLQGKCSMRNIQMVRISLQEEKQYLKYVITIWYLSKYTKPTKKGIRGGVIQASIRPCISLSAGPVGPHEGWFCI